MNAQDSLTDQINNLIALGNNAGLYDAVDLLRRLAGYDPPAPPAPPAPTELPRVK